MTPETHFAESDGVNIAYQVFGEGPGDLVFIHGLYSNLDLLWEEPRVARFLLALLKTALDMDLRAILPTISTPTLVLQATRDLVTRLESGRDFANRIPGAQLVEIDSDDHSPWASCNDDILREIGRFLGESSGTRIIDRVLTTVLFTDIVDSTKLAAEMGDQKWGDLLEEHHKMIRHELKVFRGHEVKTTGDGFHATFDGPARAIQCADAIRDSTRQLGLNLRLGIHTGECEIRGESLEGLAIHIAARVSSMAAGGDLLVSRTVKDLVAGSGIEFEDFGTHSLRGIPGEHRLFKVIEV
jgi:class 3 adenylate cyclase